MTSPHDADEVEALLTDRYIDSLLAAAERHAHDAPAEPALDPSLRRTARLLRRDLVRVHPSFRFEERLARTLAETATRLRAEAARAEGTRSRVDPGPLDLDRSRASRPLAFRRRGDDLARRRPLIIGGAMASAALSLAGAAIVVARRRGGPAAAMTRAARAAHRASRSPRRVGRARRTRLA